MNQKLFNIGLLFAVAGIAVKYIVFQASLPFEYGIYAYFLFILFALFFGMRKAMEVEGYHGFGRLIKNGMKVASIYAVVVSIFTYIYYRFIDASFFTARIAERVLAAKEQGMTEEQIEIIRSESSIVFSASTQSSLTLLGFMFAGLVYSLIWGFIFARIPKSRGI